MGLMTMAHHTFQEPQAVRAFFRSDALQAFRLKGAKLYPLPNCSRSLQGHIISTLKFISLCRALCMKYYRFTSRRSRVHTIVVQLASNHSVLSPPKTWSHLELTTVPHHVTCWHEPGIRDCLMPRRTYTTPPCYCFVNDSRIRSLRCCWSIVKMAGSDEYPQENVSLRSLRYFLPKRTEYGFLIFSDQ